MKLIDQRIVFVLYSYWCCKAAETRAINNIYKIHAPEFVKPAPEMEIFFRN